MRPNILILMVDQLAGTLWPDGPAPWLHAPNLRRLAERSVRFADRFQAGEVLLEITKLRQPCRTLDLIRKGIQLELYDTTPGAANWGRGGFYARVIEGGAIRPGDIIAKAEDPDV